MDDGDGHSAALEQWAGGRLLPGPQGGQGRPDTGLADRVSYRRITEARRKRF
jgi:hypothetical protein